MLLMEIIIKCAETLRNSRRNYRFICTVTSNLISQSFIRTAERSDEKKAMNKDSRNFFTVGS